MHFGAAAVILLQSLSLLPYGLAIFYLEPGKADFTLKYAGCNDAFGRASNYTMLRSNATGLSDICGNLTLQVDQTSGNASSLLGYFSLNVLVSTKDDCVTAQEIGTAGAVNPSSINIYSNRYSPSNLTQGSLTVSMKEFRLPLPNNTCGEMYLISSFKYFPNATENPTLSSFAFTSLAFQVQCGEESDLEVFLEKNNSTGPELKSYTLVPQVPITKQMLGLNVMVRVNAGSPLKSRTSASALQVWVYLRAKTAEMDANTTALDYQLGDVVIHKDYRLLQLGTSTYGTEQITINKTVPTDLKSVSIDLTSICGEAFIIIAVDPLRTVKDPQPLNNYVKVPVKVDCWASQDLMGSRLGACSVIPDVRNSGKSAITYTTNYLYGAAEIKAYTYQAEERSFRRLTPRDLSASQDLARNWQKIQMESNRLFTANKCLEHISSSPQKESPILESLSVILKSVVNGFLSVSFPNSNQMEQQKKIAKIGQVVGNFASAATFYDTTPALVVDSLLQAVQYLQSVNFDYIGQLTVNSSDKEDWHSRAAKALQFFLQMNPMQTNYFGYQKILNKLLWSPESLERKNWPLDSILKGREVLIWILQQQMPRTFDNLPAEITKFLTNNTGALFGPVPTTEESLRAFMVQLAAIVETAKFKYGSAIPTTTVNPITATTTVSVATTTAANRTTTTMAPNATVTTNSTLPAVTTSAANTSTISTQATTPAAVTMVTTPSTPPPSSATTAATRVATSTLPSTQLPNSSASTVSVSLGTFASTTLSLNSTGQIIVTVSTSPTPTPANFTTGGLTSTTLTPNLTTVVPVKLGSTLDPGAGLNKNASADSLVLDKLAVIGSLINAANRPDIIKRLTKVINKVQAIVALKTEWMLTEGASVEPNMKELCDYYAATKLGTTLDSSAPLWKADNDAIYRGDLSAVTGRYYWTQIAICSCDGGASQSSQHLPPGFKTPK